MQRAPLVLIGLDFEILCYFYLLETGCGGRVGAGIVGDNDPVVGDVRTLRGGVEVVRDQPGVLLALHRRGAVLVEVQPVGVHCCEECRQCGAGDVADLLDGDV